jgi:hypothetical protein
MMQKHKEQLVKYVVGDVDKEVAVTPRNYIERRLILAPHNETTSQANNGHDMRMGESISCLYSLRTMNNGIKYNGKFVYCPRQ